MHAEHLYPDRESLYKNLLDFCVTALREDLAAQDRLSFLLSGGNSPLPLYEQLARAELPWQQLFPALVDERWVELDDPGSNEGMLRRCFASNQIFLQHLCGMKTAAATALDAEQECNARYSKLPAASFCLLGMGPDGHTASLFPGARGLQEALDSPLPCKALMAQPSAVTGSLTERMSLTLSGICRAVRIIVLFTGKEKWQVYQQALAAENTTGFPVSAVLQQQQSQINIFYSP